jgi:hypothetical protein
MVSGAGFASFDVSNAIPNPAKRIRAAFGRDSTRKRAPDPMNVSVG